MLSLNVDAVIQLVILSVYVCVLLIAIFYLYYSALVDIREADPLLQSTR